MFNERGMTSRQSFGSRLYAILKEHSADAASTSPAPGRRFGKAFLGSEVPARDRRPGTARISCLHLFSLQMPLVPLWAKPQGAVATVGRAGSGEAWLRAWAQPGTCSHALLLHGTSPVGPATAGEMERSLHGAGHPSLCHIMGSGVVARNLG